MNNTINEMKNKLDVINTDQRMQKKTEQQSRRQNTRKHLS